jgi:hypothetical protein
MKLKTLSIALFAASALSASASFSLDFTGLDLSGPFEFSSADPLVIGVADFGDVLFSTEGPSADVNESQGAPAAILEAGTPIILSFISGSPVENVVLTFIGKDAGEVPVFAQTNDTTVRAAIPSGTVGISQVDFDRVGPKVPEPSVSLLGGLGLLALLRRRR